MKFFLRSSTLCLLLFVLVALVQSSTSAATPGGALKVQGEEDQSHIRRRLQTDIEDNQTQEQEQGGIAGFIQQVRDAWTRAQNLWTSSEPYREGAITAYNFIRGAVERFGGNAAEDGTNMASPAEDNGGGAA